MRCLDHRRVLIVSSCPQSQRSTFLLSSSRAPPRPADSRPTRPPLPSSFHSVVGWSVLLIGTHSPYFFLFHGAYDGRQHPLRLSAAEPPSFSFELFLLLCTQLSPPLVPGPRPPSALWNVHSRRGSLSSRLPPRRSRAPLLRGIYAQSHRSRLWPVLSKQPSRQSDPQGAHPPVSSQGPCCSLSVSPRYRKRALLLKRNRRYFDVPRRLFRLSDSHVRPRPTDVYKSSRCHPCNRRLRTDVHQSRPQPRKTRGKCPRGHYHQRI